MSDGTAPFVSLLGDKLQKKGGDVVDTKSALAGKKLVALYFSAHWCPPCRQFTPMLANWYKSNLKAKDMEIIFVSSDRDEKGFKDYFENDHGDYLALPFDARELKNKPRKRQRIETNKLDPVHPDAEPARDQLIAKYW